MEPVVLHHPRHFASLADLEPPTSHVLARGETDPLLNCAKRVLKLEYVSRLSQQPTPFSPDVSLRIFGSSLFSLATGSVRFPCVGWKTEDLDFDFYSTSGILPKTPAELFAGLLPTLKSAAAMTEATLVRPDGRRVESSEVKPPLILRRTFSAKELTRFAESFRMELHVCPATDLTVELELDVPISHALSRFLPPTVSSFSCTHGKVPLREDDWRHYLAVILCRSCTGDSFASDRDPNKFKATDVFNAYNILHSKPKLVDLHGADLRLMRALALLYMPVFYLNPLNIKLAHFEPERLTDERLSQLAHSISPLISSDKSLKALETIFPSPGTRQRALQERLTKEEIEFLYRLQGVSVEGGRSHLIEPRVSVDAFEAAFPDVLSRYPGLRKTIHLSEQLEARCESIGVSRQILGE
jgi:hypothetical protein